MNFDRQIYQTILEVTPPFLLDTVLRAASAVQYISYTRDKKLTLKKNNVLRNISSIDSAYVLATGPSIRALDLTRLVGRDCYSVSNFFLHPLIYDLNPKMHFFAPYHEPLILNEYIQWLRTADSSLPKETSMVLGLPTKPLVSNNNLFCDRNIYYLGLEKAALTKSHNICYPVLKPQTVPLMVIPVLLFMGYKRIVLIGCDHNILKDYGKSVSNFYDTKQDQRSNATSGENWSAGIIKHLENAKNVFMQYQVYKEFCELAGVELIHTSPDGWLDFIEYVPFDAL